MTEREEFSGPNYRERLDISQVFLRQLDRTNFSAATKDGSFEEYVRQTMRRLPTQWKEWVRIQSDRYERTEMVLVFRKNSGVRMGSQTDPALRDRSREVLRLEDGSVDWSDPNILSPTLKEKTTIDYEMLDEIVGEASENAGISWQIEYVAEDTGNFPDYVDRKITPYRKQRDQEQESDLENGQEV